MKVNLNRQAGIITLPEDFATLEEITGDGRFHYVVRYNVDIPRAARQKAFLVKIHVSARSADHRDVAGFVNLNSQELIDNLLTRQSERRELNRSFTQGYIRTLVSDITAKIPNDKARNLSTSSIKKTHSNHEDSKITEQTYLFSNKRFQLAKVSDLTEKNSAQPILQTPLWQPEARSITSAKTTQEGAFDLLFRYAIDPANIGRKTNQYSDTARMHQGVHQSLMGVAKDVVQDVGSVSQTKFGLLSTVLTDQKNKPANQLGLAANDYTHVLVTEQTNVVTVEEDLYIPISDTPDKFYLIFELQDVKGVETENLSSVVHHSANYAILTVPTIPPFVSVKALKGANRLELRQLDPNGAGVYIYRRAIGNHGAITDADYVQVEKLALRPQDGCKWYTDKYTGMKSVIYRVVPYNRFEVKSHEFASVVLNSTNQYAFVQAPYQRKRSFLSLSAKVVDRTVRVEVNDLPPGVLSFQIYRQDLSRNQNMVEAEKVGKAVYSDTFDPRNARFYITDELVVPRRVYSYSALLTFRDGTNLWSADIVTIDYNPVLNNVIETRLSPIKALNVGSELDIQFEINSVILDGKVDQIRNALEQQGLLGFFQNDITDNRQNLQNLIAYQIKRTNITTGEVEDLGVFIGTQFSDRTIGRTKGVKPIVPTSTYEYTVSTHFRSPESLIDTFTRTVTDTTNPDRSYTYSPSKWYHPITLSEGNLVSARSLQRNHAQEAFTFGTIGDIVFARISLPDEKPVLHEATAKPLGKGKVMVQWKIKGSSKKIDHFLVTKEEMGMKTMIGKAHALTETNNMSFVESFAPHVVKAIPAKQSPVTSIVDSTYETAVTYHITPVFFDYSQGAAVKTAQIITKKIR